MELNRKKIIASTVLNATIALLTITGAVVMFAGLEFMPEVQIIKTSRIGEFRFFTTDSNLFLGISAIVFLVYDGLVLSGRTKEIPKVVYILKFAATSAVALTFFVVFGYLEFVISGGFIRCIKNSSLFYHLLSPILSVVTFVCFERTNKLKPRHIILGVTPAAIYGIYYIINLFVHAQGNTVQSKYDFYHLVSGGLWQIIIIVPLTVVISYAISAALWALNRTKQKQKK